MTDRPHSKSIVPAPYTRADAGPSAARVRGAVVPGRQALIDQALRDAPAWVLSGPIGKWGEPLTALFDAVVFLTVPTAARIERLRARELRDFGWDALAPGGAMHDEHEAFVEWAAHYDDDTREGRSRPKHEAWLAQLQCPVIRLDGERPLGALVADVLEGIARSAAG